ncbi:MAG TPA: DUF1501 domain-containing protein [Blastocatellia bacterium]|nr:DUF1501 domain-containing protein [Blastocatellia bacterium]
MPVNRRQFIKRSASAVSLSLVMPKLWMGSLAKGQDIAATNRRILLVIQQAGGNDGLNTVVPYTDSRYSQLRPILGFKDTELKDAQGNSTILGNDPFGLNPAMSEMKALYDAHKAAIVLGVGYPNANLSHFLSMDIWGSANLNGGLGSGWLGRYADQKLLGQSGLSAVNIGGSLPKALFANQVVIPSITNFGAYTYGTDERYRGDRNNQLNTFHATNARAFPVESFAKAIADAGVDAADGAAQLQTAIAGYTSPVHYPANGEAAAQVVSFTNTMKMAAQIVSTIPGADLLYVQIGGFDTHAQQNGAAADNYTNKTTGQHANLLKAVSLGIQLFYDDMVAHGLADNVVIMTWSEFGRRPNENASHGCDHGTAAPLFVVGNAVQGGKIYGEQPSLSDLDSAGNMKFEVDFRAVYATILDKWLGTDSQSILGGEFGNMGFLG